MLGLIVS